MVTHFVPLQYASDAMVLFQYQCFAALGSAGRPPDGKVNLIGNEPGGPITVRYHHTSRVLGAG
jgi:hypothetical protein